MSKKRGLARGRGLNSLLSDVSSAQEAISSPITSQTNINDVKSSNLSVDNDASANKNVVTEILVTDLQPGKYQPRCDIAEDALQELADSIKEHGVMQPIVVREVNTTTRYEIIAGERRWRGAQLAGLTSVPALVREIDDDVAIALALIENIQREDLSAIEQAHALQRFADEFGMNHAQIAKTVGKARTTVSNLLRLLTLHADVQTMLTNGDIDNGHAKVLLALPTDQQVGVAKKVIAQNLTVRKTEQLVKQILEPTFAKENKQLDADITRLSQQLSEKLGALVEINQKKSGKGKLTIAYHNTDELDSILALLQK